MLSQNRRAVSDDQIAPDRCVVCKFPIECKEGDLHERCVKEQSKFLGKSSTTLNQKNGTTELRVTVQTFRRNSATMLKRRNSRELFRNGSMNRLNGNNK